MGFVLRTRLSAQTPEGEVEMHVETDAMLPEAALVHEANIARHRRYMVEFASVRDRDIARNDNP